MRNQHTRRHRIAVAGLLTVFSIETDAFLPSFDRHSLSSTSTLSLTPPTTTKLLLLGTDQKEDDKKNEKKSNLDNDKNDDLQLDAWIRGIGEQWPLRPPSQSSSTSAADEPENPLAALLNLEALLSLAKLQPESKKSIDNLIGSISSVLQDSAPQLSQWDRWITSRSSEEESTELEQPPQDEASSSIPPPSPSSSSSSSSDNKRFLKQATLQLESILIDASALVSPSNIQGLIGQASNLVAFGSNATISSVSDLAKRITEERGVKVTTQELKEATNLAASIVSVADALWLRPDGSTDMGVNESAVKNYGAVVDKSKLASTTRAASSRARALFLDFETASELTAFSPVVAKAAEMGALSGAIYEETNDLVHELNHTIVAKGMTEDVRWMVTDSVATADAFDELATGATAEVPIFVRTITIRGFDASDEEVDRERLLNVICSAAPETIKPMKGVLFHSGLLSIARAIYEQVDPYIEWTAPNHKLVINGHSIGGAIASLLLVLLATERGMEFVMDKVLRVYTFGSPPVVALSSSAKGKRSSNKFSPSADSSPSCEVLDAMGLPSDMILGFVQPWDPVVRLFSEIDALYPLIGDLGDDGVTPYAKGPPRSLRPIVKRIAEVWEGWPRFRENYRSSGSQQYRSVGVQHILLAEPVRYVADRFIPLNIAVPPIEAFLRISSSELLPALKVVFPLDVFEISFVPQAIRSFVHHFYPAYGSPMMDYIRRLKPKLPSKKVKQADRGVKQADRGVNGGGSIDDEPCALYVMQQDDERPSSSTRTNGRK